MISILSKRYLVQIIIVNSAICVFLSATVLLFEETVLTGDPSLYIFLCCIEQSCCFAGCNFFSLDFIDVFELFSVANVDLFSWWQNNRLTKLKILPFIFATIRLKLIQFFVNLFKFIISILLQFVQYTSEMIFEIQLQLSLENQIFFILTFRCLLNLLSLLLQAR